MLATVRRGPQWTAVANGAASAVFLRNLIVASGLWRSLGVTGARGFHVVITLAQTLAQTLAPTPTPTSLWQRIRARIRHRFQFAGPCMRARLQ